MFVERNFEEVNDKTFDKQKKIKFDKQKFIIKFEKEKEYFCLEGRTNKGIFSLTFEINIPTSIP